MNAFVTAIVVFRERFDPPRIEAVVAVAGRRDSDGGGVDLQEAREINTAEIMRIKNRKTGCPYTLRLCRLIQAAECTHAKRVA